MPACLIRGRHQRRLPVPASDADEDEEILAEIAEDEPADESDDFDEAA